MHREQTRSFFPSLVFVLPQPGRQQISSLAAVAAVAAVGRVAVDEAGDRAAAVALVVVDDDDGPRPESATRLGGPMA